MGKQLIAILFFYPLLVIADTSIPFESCFSIRKSQSETDIELQLKQECTNTNLKLCVDHLTKKSGPFLTLNDTNQETIKSLIETCTNSIQSLGIETFFSTYSYFTIEAMHPSEYFERYNLIKSFDNKHFINLKIDKKTLKYAEKNTQFVAKTGLKLHDFKLLRELLNMPYNITDEELFIKVAKDFKWLVDARDRDVKSIYDQFNKNIKWLKEKHLQEE